MRNAELQEAGKQSRYLAHVGHLLFAHMHASDLSKGLEVVVLIKQLHEQVRQLHPFYIRYLLRVGVVVASGGVGFLGRLRCCLHSVASSSIFTYSAFLVVLTNFLLLI